MASKPVQSIALSPARAGVRSPLVSVIIPAYNAARYIERTLESVLAQTYPNLEIIVVDDGSSDTTPEIVQAWTERDGRVQLVQQANGGVAIARNTGIAQANGEFIAPIDADDLWHPTNLEQQIERLTKAGEQTGVCYGWSVDIDEDDCPNGGFRAATIEGAVYRSMLCHNFLGNASSTVIRRSALEAIGGYDMRFKQRQAQGCEDWDLYLRLAERYDYCVAPQFLIGYRKTDDAMSGDYRQMGRSQSLMLNTVRQAHPEIPGFLYRLSRSSFCMYLARQSALSAQPRESLHWLGQALRAECLTPLGRYGLYQMTASSAWQILQGRGSPPEKEAATDANTAAAADLPTGGAAGHSITESAARSQSSPTNQPPFHLQQQPQGLSLGFKLGVGNLLHRLLG